jgi:hypothetical protein
MLRLCCFCSVDAEHDYCHSGLTNLTPKIDSSQLCRFSAVMTCLVLYFPWSQPYIRPLGQEQPKVTFFHAFSRTTLLPNIVVILLDEFVEVAAKVFRLKLS